MSYAGKDKISVGNMGYTIGTQTYGWDNATYRWPNYNYTYTYKMDLKPAINQILKNPELTKKQKLLLIEALMEVV